MAGTQRRSPLPSPTATSCRARLRQDICRDICREFCSALRSNLDFGGMHRTHKLTSSYAAPAEVRRRPLEKFRVMRQALHQALSAPSAPRKAIIKKRLRLTPGLPASQGDMESQSSAGEWPSTSLLGIFASCVRLHVLCCHTDTQAVHPLQERHAAGSAPELRAPQEVRQSRCKTAIPGLSRSRYEDSRHVSLQELGGGKAVWLRSRTPRAMPLQLPRPIPALRGYREISFKNPAPIQNSAQRAQGSCTDITGTNELWRDAGLDTE